MKCWFLITVKLKNFLLDLNSNHFFLPSRVDMIEQKNILNLLVLNNMLKLICSKLLRMYLTCQQLIKTPSGILRWYLRVRITWVLISSFLILTHTISCTYLLLSSYAMYSSVTFVVELELAELIQCRFLPIISHGRISQDKNGPSKWHA